MDEICFRDWLTLGARTVVLPSGGDWDLAVSRCEQYPYSPYWCARLRTEALALSSLCSDAEWDEIIIALPEEGNPRDAFYLFQDMIKRRMDERRGSAGAMLMPDHVTVQAVA